MKETNLEILDYIKDVIERYPNLRFCQILWGLKIIRHNIDNFYEESKDTLNRVEETYIGQFVE